MTKDKLECLEKRRKLQEEIAELEKHIYLPAMTDYDVSPLVKDAENAKLENARLRYENAILKEQLRNVKAMRARYDLWLRWIDTTLVDPNFHDSIPWPDHKRCALICNGIKRLQAIVTKLSGMSEHGTFDNPKRSQSTEEISNEWSDFNASRKSPTTGK